jgi:hypothetical protein
LITPPRDRLAQVPKNLLLIVAGAAAIALTGIPAGRQAAALAVFTVIASLGVAAPVVIYVALGERSTELRPRLKEWMARNNNVIRPCYSSCSGRS